MRTVSHNDGRRPQNALPLILGADVDGGAHLVASVDRPVLCVAASRVAKRAVQRVRVRDG